jgi:hypothetical protein
VKESFIDFQIDFDLTVIGLGEFNRIRKAESTKYFKHPEIKMLVSMPI